MVLMISVSFQIMSAGICKHHSPGRKRDVCRFCRAIMYDRSMRSICNDRIKTFPQKVLLFAAELVYFSAALSSVMVVLVTFFLSQWINLVTAIPSLICAILSFSISVLFLTAFGRVRFGSSRIVTSDGILLTRRLLTFALESRTFLSEEMV